MYCHARTVEVVNLTLLVPGTHPFLDAVEPAVLCSNAALLHMYAMFAVEPSCLHVVVCMS